LLVAECGGISEVPANAVTTTPLVVESGTAAVGWWDEQGGG